MKKMVQKIFPAFEWLRKYKQVDLSGDLTAGILIAVMLIPQGMAYAMLAGLPPVMGLYASTLPLAIYAIFGSSRHLAVGPVAMVSLLVFAGVSAHAEPHSDQYIGFVFVLSFLVGAIQFLMGILRLGFFVNFISHAVISGFSSAAAVIIFVSQLHHVLGIDLQSKHSVFHILAEAGQRVGEINPIALMVGMGSLIVQILLRKKAPRFPAPLLVVAAGALLVYSLGLGQFGMKIVGNVPKGLPNLSLPRFNLETISLLFPDALTILFVGFMESISVAELIAAKENYKIDANQELKGLGLANIFASFFSAFPVTGGFSRTAVNYQAGARTGLASIVTAGWILLILLFFTPLFYYLPNAVLASIVMVAVTGLVDVKEVKRLLRLKKVDGWTLILTFITTLVFGSEKGIFIGVAFSLLVFIWRSAHPHAAELGYLEREGVFRNIKRYPEATIYPGTLVLRVDASLYFANVGFLEDILRKNIADKPGTQWVILDLSGVNDMDAVAVDTLEEIMNRYKDRNIQFLFAGMKGPVRDLVAKAGWEDKFGTSIQSPSIRHALEKVKSGGS